MNQRFVDRRTRPRPEHETSVQRIYHRFMSLVIYSDTTPTRFMLALAASCWAVMLWMPGDTFQRPVYYYMRMVVGDGPTAEWKWAMLWTVHAAGMWWRTFSAVPRPWVALLINSLGVLLFWGAAISIFLTLTFPIPAAIAPDIVLALASFWVLVRTAVNSEHNGWRVD